MAATGMKQKWYKVLELLVTTVSAYFQQIPGFIVGQKTYPAFRNGRFSNSSDGIIYLQGPFRPGYSIKMR